MATFISTAAPSGTPVSNRNTFAVNSSEKERTIKRTIILQKQKHQKSKTKYRKKKDELYIDFPSVFITQID